MCGHVRCALGWQVHMGVRCVPISEGVNPGMKAMGPVCGPYRVRGGGYEYTTLSEDTHRRSPV